MHAGEHLARRGADAFEHVAAPAPSAVVHARDGPVRLFDVERGEDVGGALGQVALLREHSV